MYDTVRMQGEGYVGRDLTVIVGARIKKLISVLPEDVIFQIFTFVQILSRCYVIYLYLHYYT